MSSSVGGFWARRVFEIASIICSAVGGASVLKSEFVSGQYHLWKVLTRRVGTCWTLARLRMASTSMFWYVTRWTFACWLFRRTSR